MKDFCLLLVSGLLLYGNLKSQCTANFSCAINSNGNVFFTNLSTGTSTDATYQWDFGNNQYAYTGNATHIYGGNGTYSVTLSLSDSTGNCSSSITQTLVISNVTCNITAGFTPNISGGFIQFVNTTTGTYPGTTYHLDFGDGTQVILGNFTNTAHNYKNSGTYTVILTAQNSLTCSSVYSSVITATVPSCGANVNFTYTISGNGIISFGNASTGLGPNPFFEWNFGTSAYSYVLNPPPQSYPYNGAFVVTLTLWDSTWTYCKDVNTQTINVTGVSSCPINASFVMAKDSSVIPAIVWNAYPSYPMNTSLVTWNWGDGSSSTGLFPSHTYSAPGMYNICMSVTLSCGSFTTICLNANVNKTVDNLQIAQVNVMDVTTGIRSIDNTSQIVIYPNPAKDLINIESKTSGNKIIINDLLGKTVLSQVQKENTSVIDISRLGPGIYLIKVSGKDCNSTISLIKE